MQREITQKITLLNKNGTLAVKGYATTMNFVYNREYAKKRPFKLKECNFYQFLTDRYSVQLTLGHLTYACNVSLNVIDLQTGRRWQMATTKLFKTLNLDKNPQQPSTNEFRNKHFYFKFEVTETERILYAVGQSEKFANVEVKIVAENDVNNPKMVIATPFAKKSQFYLNYKENYYRVSGFVRFDDLLVRMENAVGLVDWGRGVWPYRHQWFWGNLTTIVDEKLVGLNIGWGFGDNSHATENIYFVDKKPYKVGALQVQRDTKDYMKPWHIFDQQGMLELTFCPTFDNYTQNKLIVVDTHCHQLYGKFSGWLNTEHGKIQLNDVLAFLEHAVNKW